MRRERVYARPPKELPSSSVASTWTPCSTSSAASAASTTYVENKAAQASKPDQLALRRLLSALDRAAGCTELRPA